LCKFTVATNLIQSPFNAARLISMGLHLPVFPTTQPIQALTIVWCTGEKQKSRFEVYLWRHLISETVL